jgi:hypothetical protein
MNGFSPFLLKCLAFLSWPVAALCGVKAVRNPDKTIPYRFKPGQVANPTRINGKHAVALSKAYKQQLAQPYPNDPQGPRWVRAVFDRLSWRICVSPEMSEHSPKPTVAKQLVSCPRFARHNR